MTTTMRKKKRNVKARKWQDEFYVRIYELVRSGIAVKDVGISLGISQETWARWRRIRPAVRDAIQRAKKANDVGDREQFKDYVYERLPEHLQSLWDQIQACEQSSSDYDRIESLLQASGETTRQHLFLYALVYYNFNPSHACRVVGINTKTLERWKRESSEFGELVEEIHWHKKNFFEGALAQLVKNGDTSAIIFANKTLNKDRGYTEKIDVSVSGTVRHEHEVINVDELGLPLEIRKAILEAYRARMGDKKEGIPVPGGRVLGAREEE